MQVLCEVMVCPGYFPLPESDIMIFMDYRLSKHAQDVISARSIQVKWINAVFDDPSRIDTISEHETHYFKTIAEHDDRCLKVVFNPTTLIVITVYFDRAMRKRGCK